jgi:hypothetical protein
VDKWRTDAARNNAEWCDIVCRSHGATTRFDADAWTSSRRTPPYYPDAVTLIPEPSVPDLLSRIDGSAGCSIKDSFAALDLSEHGFRLLFEAQWMVRTEPPPRAPRAPGTPTADQPRADHGWEKVEDPKSLEQWEEAWRPHDGPTGLFRAELLDRDSVTFLAGRRGRRYGAGAILHQSATVVGLSNFFSRPGPPAADWAGCLALADSLFPASTLVGYETDDSDGHLDTAERQGFARAGALRVWIRGT